MPYVYDPNLEDEENQGASGAEVQISGASPTTDSEGSDSVSAAPKKEGINTGSGFQNLDSYLNTNQSKEFGQQVLGKVGQEVESAKQNQASAADQFKQQVSDNSKVPTSEQVNSAIANPLGANKQDFQSWMTQSYQGPRSLGESADTWNQYWSGSNKANSSAQALGSEAGRFALLDSYFGKPNYSFGEKSLDNLLVQQSGLGKQTRDLQNQAALLKSQGQEQAKGLQNFASQRSGEVEQSKGNVLSAIGLDAKGNVITGDQAGAIGQQYKTVEDALTAANQQRKSQQDATAANVAKNQFTPEELSALGLGAGENIYNLNLSDYLKLGGDLNRNQTMTPEQRAYIQALSELSGITDTYASGAVQEVDSPYSFDVNRLRQDAASTQAEYQRMLKEAPVIIPSAWTRNGEGKPISLQQLRDDIAHVQARQAGSKPNDFERRTNNQYLSEVIPILKQAEAELASRYQISRTVGGK